MQSRCTIIRHSEGEREERDENKDRILRIGNFYNYKKLLHIFLTNIEVFVVFCVLYVRNFVLNFLSLLL